MGEEGTEYLREKVWTIMNTIMANQLYVHSSMMEVKFETEDENIKALWENSDFKELIERYKEEKEEGKKQTSPTGRRSGSRTGRRGGRKSKRLTIHIPEILTVAVLNALVPNSAMLLIGGHGGGKSSLVKYLGRMFTGKPLKEVEEAIIRGHPQLTEEKMIATYNIAKLIHKGEEQVIWRKFTTSFWKILDEVNRMSPYSQNILLSMLAEGQAKYYDHVYFINKYVLYATMNPSDSGTFEMAPPFLDRFGISVYITMPTSYDLSLILGAKDDKLTGYDELGQLPAVLDEEQLRTIWFLVDRIEVDEDAENFIHSLIREFNLCDKTEKGNNELLNPETGLCLQCHFNTEKVICNKVLSILSVRVAKDLLRYSKALAWLLGSDKVTVSIVSTIAPYVITHRVGFIEREVRKAPFWGDKLEYCRHLIKLALKRFDNRKECYAILTKFRNGVGTDDDMEILKGYAGTDLIVKRDILPLAESLSDPIYKDTVKLINGLYKKKDLDGLTELYDKLMRSPGFTNRGELIDKIRRYLVELTEWSREFVFGDWEYITTSISIEFPELSGFLKRTRKGDITLKVATHTSLFVEVNITGKKMSSRVQLRCYGGKNALKLKEYLDEKFPPEEYTYSNRLMVFLNIGGPIKGEDGDIKEISETPEISSEKKKEKVATPTDSRDTVLPASEEMLFREEQAVENTGGGQGPVKEDKIMAITDESSDMDWESFIDSITEDEEE